MHARSGGFAPAGYTEYILTAPTKGLLRYGHLGENACIVGAGTVPRRDIHNHEGRAIALEYPIFTRTPCAQLPRTSWRHRLPHAMGGRPAPLLR